MYSLENQTCSLTQLGLIKAIIQNKYDLVFHCRVKIFTSDKKKKRFLYSDLCGCLCFVINLTTLNFHFIVFDLITFEKLFDAVLYDNFLTWYIKLKQNFYCFEVLNGFVGLYFEDSLSAKQLYLTMKENLNNDFAKKRRHEYVPIYEDRLKEITNKKIQAIQSHILSEYNIEDTDTASREVKDKLIVNEDKITESISHFYFNDNSNKIVYIGNKATGTKIIQQNKLLSELFTVIQAEEIEINDIDSFISIMSRHLINEDNAIQGQINIRTMKSNLSQRNQNENSLIDLTHNENIAGSFRKMNRNTLLNIRNNRAIISNDSSTLFNESRSNRQSIYSIYDANKIRNTNTKNSGIFPSEGFGKPTDFRHNRIDNKLKKQLSSRIQTKLNINNMNIEENDMTSLNKQNKTLGPINSIIFEEVEKEKTKKDIHDTQKPINETQNKQQQQYMNELKNFLKGKMSKIGSTDNSIDNSKQI